MYARNRAVLFQDITEPLKVATGFRTTLAAFSVYRIGEDSDVWGIRRPRTKWKLVVSTVPGAVSSAFTATRALSQNEGALTAAAMSKLAADLFWINTHISNGMSIRRNV